MNPAVQRVEVLHGVNLDQLHRRAPAHYGSLSLAELEARIAADARTLRFAPAFFHTNHEGEFVERLHAIGGQAAGIVLNPGAWTHYSVAIRDALELTGLPAVEVHLSDIHAREAFRRHSVIEDLCLEQVCGQGPDGYRVALERLRLELDR